MKVDEGGTIAHDPLPFLYLFVLALVVCIFFKIESCSWNDKSVQMPTPTTFACTNDHKLVARRVKFLSLCLPSMKKLYPNRLKNWVVK